MNFNLQQPENKIIDDLSKLELDNIKKICDKNKHIFDICQKNQIKLFTLFYKNKGYKSFVDDFARDENLLVQFYKIDPTFTNNQRNIIDSYIKKQKRITTFLLANQPETHLIKDLSTKFSDSDIAKMISESQNETYLTEIIRYNVTIHEFDDKLLTYLLNKSKYMDLNITKYDNSPALHKDWKNKLRNELSKKLSSHIGKTDLKQPNILELFVSAITNKWTTWTDKLDSQGFSQIANILYFM